MELFNFQFDSSKNLLPKDGVVNYFGKIFSEVDANFYFNSLLENIEWRNDEVLMYGKTIVTKRKVAWYGDDNFEYTYSKKTKKALIWTKELLALKQVVEEKTGEKFNSCLLNLYHNGKEGMSWHSDDEKDLVQNSAIASLSFGAARKFSFKHKSSKDTLSIQLENGSLLVMKDVTQAFWLHQLPQSKKVLQPRINLTFRTII